MNTHVELLLANNGSWIAVDTEMCEWVFGFGKEDKILITYLECGKAEEAVAVVKDVIMMDGEKLLIARTGESYVAIPERLIVNIEGV